MKMFRLRLVPLVLAGLCGYLHTVINRTFDEMGDLIPPQGSSAIDAPNANNPQASLAGFVDKGNEQSAGETPTEAGRLPAHRVDMGSLLGPAVDEMESTRDTFDWKPPQDNVRVLADSAEYQKMLLDYTMNLLPNHRDPTASKGNEGSKSEHEEEAFEDLNNPKPYAYNDIDIIVPASGQDDRLGIFAERLGVALTNFLEWYETERKPAVMRRIKQEEEEQEPNADEDGTDLKPNNYDLDLKFRLFITRYPEDAQKTEEDYESLLTEISEKTTLPKEQIKLIRVGQESEDDQEFLLKFNRAHARNVLLQNACQQDDCIVTAFDVDMQVLPIFFHQALRSVQPHVRAYFPIVFSEFNPATVQLVQDYVHPAEGEDPMLEPFSRHRGLWRDFGYGMYVLAGSDAKRFRFNEEHHGWGHEDNDFYKLVHNAMRVDRQREHGLIHSWHNKNCDPGIDIITQQQWIDCLNSRDVMEGSALGLLLRPALPTYKKEDFPGLPTGVETETPKYKNTKIVQNDGDKKDKDGENKDEAKEGEENNNDGNANNEGDNPEGEENNEDNAKKDEEKDQDQEQNPDQEQNRENPPGENAGDNPEKDGEDSAGEDAADGGPPANDDQANGQQEAQETRRRNLQDQEQNPESPAEENAGGNPDKDGLSAYTIAQLKKKLRAAGLSVGGPKTELVNRLRQHYRFLHGGLPANDAQANDQQETQETRRRNLRSKGEERRRDPDDTQEDA